MNLNEERTAATSDVLPVGRTKAEAKRFYDRVSGFYDHLTRAFERRFALPAGSRDDAVKARYSDGVLELRIAFDGVGCSEEKNVEVV